MLEPALNDQLLASGGTLCPPASAIGGFASFGDSAAEIAALNAQAVVVPLPGLIRLLVTGRDRAKYVHNFCTNNVTALSTGGWCEAFFTDVKAHVLGHGFVLVCDDAIELWLLAGDETSLLNHLQKYIITEDVTVTSRTAETTAFAIAGPAAAHVSTASPVLRTSWDGVPLVLTAVPVDDAAAAWNGFVDGGLRPAGMEAFDHLRIRERFPLVGVDLTDDHLAPEADRNRAAISYTKGCYLGQEPIARLDSMGHLNRSLKRVGVTGSHAAVAGGIVRTSDGVELGQLTSVAPGTNPGEAVALGVLKVKGLSTETTVVVQDSSGETCPAGIS